MNDKVWFSIGTLLNWAGWIFLLRFVFIAASLYARIPGLDQRRSQRGMMLSAVIAAVGFIAGNLIPGVSGGHGFRFPIVWFAMPFSAWLTITAIILAVVRFGQGWLSTSADDRTAKTRAGLIWLLVVVAGFVYYRWDPENKIAILTGGIQLEPTTAISIVLLAIAATIAMALASRAVVTRGYAKTIATQVALLAGSVVFGLPFAFLLITSFKEDRDMSSPNGIVWIPKVQNTMKFFDEKDPLYQGTMKGQTVVGSIIAHKPDGTVTIDIARPHNLVGIVFQARPNELKEIAKDAPVVTAAYKGQHIRGLVVQEMNDGRRRVSILEPASLRKQETTFAPAEVEPVRSVGLRWENYTEALEYLPPDTDFGLVYLKNTLLLVVFNVIGTILSSAIVAYAFSRMKFPGRDALFAVLLSTMMLPGAVTLLPQFLIWKNLHAIDTLYPLWVGSFFGSAFNVFLLRQFFKQIPNELEDAAKIDGCSYVKTFWSIMLPQIKPALAVIAIWTFMGAWNNFMGPLIYINSPENMPISYGLQQFMGDRGGEPGLLMAFTTMTIVPVLLLFFFCQKYFIEGVTLSGLGGR